MKKEYDYINPPHYKQWDVETVEMMRRIWGDEEVAIWAKLSAFSYQMRMGFKPDNSVEQEMKKIKWCLNKVNELKSNSKVKPDPTAKYRF